jgi:hypothetical protein
VTLYSHYTRELTFQYTRELTFQYTRELTFQYTRELTFHYTRELTFQRFWQTRQVSHLPRGEDRALHPHVEGEGVVGPLLALQCVALVHNLITEVRIGVQVCMYVCMYIRTCTYVLRPNSPTHTMYYVLTL